MPLVCFKPNTEHQPWNSFFHAVITPQATKDQNRIENMLVNELSQKHEERRLKENGQKTYLYKFGYIITGWFTASCFTLQLIYLSLLNFCKSINCKFAIKFKKTTKSGCLSVSVCAYRTNENFEYCLMEDIWSENRWKFLVGLIFYFLMQFFSLMSRIYIHNLMFVNWVTLSDTAKFFVF